MCAEHRARTQPILIMRAFCQRGRLVGSLQAERQGAEPQAMRPAPHSSSLSPSESEMTVLVAPGTAFFFSPVRCFLFAGWPAAGAGADDGPAPEPDAGGCAGGCGRGCGRGAAAAGFGFFLYTLFFFG